MIKAERMEQNSEAGRCCSEAAGGRNRFVLHNFCYFYRNLQLLYFGLHIWQGGFKNPRFTWISLSSFFYKYIYICWKNLRKYITKWRCRMWWFSGEYDSPSCFHRNSCSHFCSLAFRRLRWRYSLLQNRGTKKRMWVKSAQNAIG
jgi:hypothetical protein